MKILPSTYQYLVLRNSYHGAYRQGIIRGVPPSPNVSAQTPYVLGGWATPVWSGGCPCRLLPYVYPSSEHCPLYGYRLQTRGDLYTSTPYNANWALYFLCSGRLHFENYAHRPRAYVSSNAHSRSTSFANARAITSTSKTHNFISSRELDPSSWRVFREAGNSNALGTVVWIRSGTVRRFTWVHSCTSTLFLHLPFAISFAWWILSPLRLKPSATLPPAHWHAILQSVSKSHESDGNPAVNRRVFDGSVILPLLSAGTRGAYSFFKIASNWTLSRWVASPIAKLVSPSRHLSVQVVTRLSRLSPVFPGCHPVYSRVPNGQCLGEVLRNSYHGAYRQGIIRGVPPSPNVSAQTPYVLGGWATPVWSGGCPCRLLPYVYPSSEHCPLYGYRLQTRGDLYTSTPYNANWALYLILTCSWDKGPKSILNFFNWYGDPAYTAFSTNTVLNRIMVLSSTSAVFFFLISLWSWASRLYENPTKYLSVLYKLDNIHSFLLFWLLAVGTFSPLTIDKHCSLLGGNIITELDLFL